MWRYSYNLKGLYETPVLPDSVEGSWDRAVAAGTIQEVRQAGRSLLTEFESKKLLSAYGIPTVETRIASSESEAVKAAEEIGFPVVLKLFSQTLTHKSDVGGVVLDLRGTAAVRSAFRAIKSSVKEKAGRGHFLGVTVQPMVKNEGYEIIVGSTLDPQFGPVLLFGSGGQLVEVYRDRALALPPLNTTLARRMMEQTRVFSALQGVRGRKPANIAGLEQLLVQFSQIVVEQPWIKEMDINPLLVTIDRIVALDARVVVHGPEVTSDTLPRVAIRPYPTQYITPWTTKNGTPITIRPIRPEDEPAMARFHETLSDRSVYFRYFHPIRLNQRVAHERLQRMCFIDYSREMALVADHRDPQTGTHEILGVGRLIKLHASNDGEFAIVVSDRCQGQGLGTELLRRLVQIGREEKLSRIVGDVLPENRDMLRVCEKLGFKRIYGLESGVVRTELELSEIP
jgi:acetyltransferase